MPTLFPYTTLFRSTVVLRRALWSRLAQPGAALVLPGGSRRWRVSAYDLTGLATELQERGVRYGTGRGLLATGSRTSS